MRKNVFGKISIFVFLLLAINPVCGQISSGGLPASFGSATKSSTLLSHSELDSVDVGLLLDEEEQKGIPNRYGIVQNLAFDLLSEVEPEQVGETFIYRHEINCPGAVSMAVNFGVYDIPDEAQVFVYSSDKKNIRGAFSSLNNKAGGQFNISEIPGNSIIVEYNVPVNAVFKGDLQIKSLATAYQELELAESDWIGVNCPEGEDWQDVKRSVCLMSYQDERYIYSCTGSLVNNVNEDETPYFLTANHCISSDELAQTLVTYFNYENSECDSDDASFSQSLSGAELVANSDDSDFSLLKLQEYPPSTYQAYYAGWNASDDQPESGTSIHQPEGEYKCIAFDYDAPKSYASRIVWEDDNVTSSNSHWEISYELGTDESGSSGGPLFDESKRVIGQLHGGDDSHSYFGKFSVSWDKNASSSEQLKYWLDPDDTGIERLDGLDYAGVPEAGFEAEVTLACIETAVAFTDDSKHSPDHWLWTVEPETVEFINGTSDTSASPEIAFFEPGLYSVSLAVSNEYGEDTLLVVDLIEAVDDLNVLFADYKDEIELCAYELSDYYFIASGGYTYDFDVTNLEKFDVEVSYDTLFLSVKDDVLQEGSFDANISVVGSHGSCEDMAEILLHVFTPENDDVENAIELKLGANSYFSNRCGTLEDNEPEMSDYLLDNTVWFSFLGPTAGSADIQVSGAATNLAIYQANSYNSILWGTSELIGSQENLYGDEENTMQDVALELGMKYWLQVVAVDDEYGDLSINILSNSLEVYPNPSSGKFYFTVSDKEGGSAEVAVYTIRGQRIFSTVLDISLESNTVELDLTGQSPGVYFFRAQINGQTLTKKIVLTN